MEMEEALIYKQVLNIKDTIKRKDDSIKRLEKCVKIGKQEGISDSDLITWNKRISELREDKHRLNGELQNIYHTCEHDFVVVGTINTLFGVEDVYQCNKCGYQTIMEKNS
jgi:predicted phage-related endonuclease